MSSSADIVRFAMKRLGVLGPSEDPSARDASDGLAALNAMLAGWAGDGVNVSPDVPLPARHEEGVIALLAVRLSSDYPGALKPEAMPSLIADADKGWRRLQAEYISPGLASFDSALVSTPSRMAVYGSAINAWAQSTAYAEFDRIEANRKIYECIVAGTSASTGTGPSSTGAEETDGTVTWRFLYWAN